MNGSNERKGIDDAHIAAITPTPGVHEIEVPDPYCFGDDPCVCIQVKAAREDERQRVKRVERPLWHLKGATWGREQGWNEALDAARDAVPHDEGCLSADADADDRDCNCWRPSALAAIDALRGKSND